MRVDVDGVSRLRKRIVLVLVTLAAIAVAMPTASASAHPCAYQSLIPTSDNGAQVRSATLCLINKERVRRGRVALTADLELRKVAQGYAEQMVKQRFFDHVSPQGSTLLGRVLDKTNYLTGQVRYWLGENLAWGTGVLATPRKTVIAWMNSPGHKRNILNPNFRQIGIGVATGAPVDTQGADGATYATEFGNRAAG